MNGVNCHKYRHLFNELRNLSSGLYLTVAPWDDTSEDAKIDKATLLDLCKKGVIINYESTYYMPLFFKEESGESSTDLTPESSSIEVSSDDEAEEPEEKPEPKPAPPPEPKKPEPAPQAAGNLKGYA